MDLTRLSYFVAVADARSFSRAAAALHLSQPALSRQVCLLEEEVGQRLLERTGRGALPTEAGAALLAHARAIFELAERADADMRERGAQPRGRLTVGLPPRVARVIGAELVQRFHALFPGATITVVEDLSIRLREAMISGRLDLALAYEPPRSPQLQQEVLVREPLVLASRQPLPARVRLADLAGRRLVMPSGPHALRRLVEEQAQPRRVPLEVIAEVDSVQTVLSIVAQGVADSVLPASAIGSLPESEGLHVAAIHSPVIRSALVLLVPVARPATRLSRRGAELLKELAAKAFSRPSSPASPTRRTARR